MHAAVSHLYRRGICSRHLLRTVHGALPTHQSVIALESAPTLYSQVLLYAEAEESAIAGYTAAVEIMNHEYAVFIFDGHNRSPGAGMFPMVMGDVLVSSFSRCRRCVQKA